MMPRSRILIDIDVILLIGECTEYSALPLVFNRGVFLFWIRNTAITQVLT